MRQFAILLVAIVALVAGQASAGTLKDVFVTVKLDGLKKLNTIMFRELDDGMTAGQLGNKVLERFNLAQRGLEGVLLSTDFTFYELDQTLKQNGIGDGFSLECWTQK